MLQLLPQAGRLNSVLCLGAHADDIEIGCAGAIMRLAEDNPALRFEWVVFAAEGVRRAEACASAKRLFPDDTRCRVQIMHFRDSYFPHDGAAIKDSFERLAQAISPDLIFTHRLEDRHQDHRLLAELTWNTFRRHLILEYEIPKFEGDLGHPNVFVPLSEDIANRKVALLMESFGSQKERPWFTEGVFRGLMHLRGMECRAPSGVAEAFHARKIIL